jgi:hypothetical protein
MVPGLKLMFSSLRDCMINTHSHELVRSRNFVALSITSLDRIGGVLPVELLEGGTYR